MALTKINGNQISTTTQAIINSLNFNATDSIFRLPAGTTAQRPTGVSYGTLRFNLQTDLAEVYVTNSDGLGTDGWVTVGAGGPHIGSKPTSYIRTNSDTIDETLTLGPTANGGSQYTHGILSGPVSIAYGYTLTVETGSQLAVVGDQPSITLFDQLVVGSYLDATNGRIDQAAVRDSVVDTRVNPLDTMYMIDYNNTRVVHFENVQQNFDINILNLPVTNIGNYGTDSNRGYSFKIIYYNSSNAFRPTGNIYINGSYACGTYWYGNGGAGIPGFSTSRYVVINMNLYRVTQITDFVGSLSTNWICHMNVEQYA